MYWASRELTKNVVHEPVRPHAVQKSLPKDTPPAEEKGILTEISIPSRHGSPAFPSGETQEGSIEARPPKPDAKAPSTEQRSSHRQGKWTMYSTSGKHWKRVVSRRIRPLAEIPDYLKKGIVATEDRRFYEHGAMDLIGVARCFQTISLRNAPGRQHHHPADQKNIFLSNDRTMDPQDRRAGARRPARAELQQGRDPRALSGIPFTTVTMPTASRKPAAPTLASAQGARPRPVRDARRSPQAPSAYDPISHPKEGARSA